MSHSNSNDAPPAAESQSVSQVLEQLAKAAGSAFAFAYVSGYFIVNSYLSGFDIKRGGSDVFKATYIYVGFFYLLFLSIFAVAASGAKLLYDAKKKREPSSVTRAGDKSPLNESLISRAFRVWAGVLILLESCLVFQISTINPISIRDYISFQFALLISVAMYQLTYYRSLHSYKWDRDSRLVQRIRTWCLVVQSLFAFLLFASLSRPGLIFDKAENLYHRGRLFDLGIFGALVLPTVALFFPLALSSSRRTALEDDGYSRPILDLLGALRKGTRKELLLTVTYMVFFAAVIWPTAYCGDSVAAYAYRWNYIKYTDLFFAVAVLSGVILQSAGMGLRRKAAEGAHEHDAANAAAQPTMEWKRWVLRVTSVILLYVATTLGYAYVIYDHIPVSKNGGDYTTASHVTIFLHDEAPIPTEQDIGRSKDSAASPSHEKKSKSKGLLQGSKLDVVIAQGVEPIEVPVDDGYPCLRGRAKSCTGLIILDEDASFLYVTKADGPCKSPKGNIVPHCGPEMWRDGFENRMGPFRPFVVAVSLSRISSIEDQ
jgi:hypothetical protein